jgi:hypothetical protein
MGIPVTGNAIHLKKVLSALILDAVDSQSPPDSELTMTEADWCPIGAGGQAEACERSTALVLEFRETLGREEHNPAECLPRRWLSRRSGRHVRGASDEQHRCGPK